MCKTLHLAALFVAASILPSCERETGPAGQPAVKLGSGTWKVELAMDAHQRYQGLSDRPRIPEDAGMLFLYPSPRRLAFCMRKCLVPLDIAFLDAEHRVVKTYTMQVEPYGEQAYSYESLAPAQFALELAAGQLRKAGVKEGDVAQFSNIPNPAKAKEDPGR